MSWKKTRPPNRCERGALRLMSQAGFDAEDTMPRMERYNLDQ